jgi:hypothetical protein
MATKRVLVAIIGKFLEMKLGGGGVVATKNVWVTIIMWQLKPF